MAKCKVVRATLPNGNKVLLIVEILCTRCGREHSGLFADRFVNPVVIAGEVFSFHAVCPFTAEPILIGGDSDTDKGFGNARWQTNNNSFSLAS